MKIGGLILFSQRNDLCCIVNVRDYKAGADLFCIFSSQYFCSTGQKLPSYSIFMKAKVLRGPACLAHFKEKCTLSDLLACLVTSTLDIFFYEQTSSRSGP